MPMNTIIRAIENAERVELTGEDICQILEKMCDPNSPNIITYSDLFDYDSIDDVLGEKGYVMLLYQIQNRSSGHWTCLFKQKDHLVFFDPYGLAPDEEQKFIPAFHSLDNKGESVPHLTLLLQNSKYKVLHNTHKYQSDRRDVNTCGRHCCVRLKFRDLTPKQYHELMSVKDIDFMVSSLTLLYSL